MCIRDSPNRAGEKDNAVEATPGSVRTVAIAAAASVAVCSAEIGPDKLPIGLDGPVTMHPPSASAEKTTKQPIEGIGESGSSVGHVAHPPGFIADLVWFTTDSHWATIGRGLAATHEYACSSQCRYDNSKGVCRAPLRHGIPPGLCCLPGRPGYQSATPSRHP